jgi:hypothetical protein
LAEALGEFDDQLPGRAGPAGQPGASGDDAPGGTDGSGNRGGRRPQGALVEELARLLQSWQENLRGHVGPECRVCPVCQAIAVVRQARPEVLDHLVNAAGEVAVAVRLAVGQPESTPPPGGRSKAPVEHIDVTD